MLIIVTIYRYIVSMDTVHQGEPNPKLVPAILPCMNQLVQRVDEHPPQVRHTLPLKSVLTMPGATLKTIDVLGVRM